MAAAILRERLIGGVAALALVFATTVLVLIVVGVACLIGDAVSRRRKARQLVADAAARGSLYAYLDDCVLVDPELAEGFRRLDDAIHNDQPQGDQ